VVLTNKTRTGTPSAGTIPITIDIVNTGPVNVTGVTLQLPTNMTLAANSPCATAFNVLKGTTFSCLDAIYAITPAVAEGPNNAVSLTVTASSADLIYPMTTTQSVDLSRNASLTITPSLIGTINKTGKRIVEASTLPASLVLVMAESRVLLFLLCRGHRHISRDHHLRRERHPQQRSDHIHCATVLQHNSSRRQPELGGGGSPGEQHHLQQHNDPCTQYGAVDQHHHHVCCCEQDDKRPNHSYAQPLHGEYHRCVSPVDAALRYLQFANAMH
jgi:hypothetical protein